MKSKNRTSVETAWHTTVCQYGRDYGWLNKVFGGVATDPYQYQLDHVIGAQAKRKVNLVSQKVGEFVVIPVPIELHDITSNHKLNRTLRPAAFKGEFGDPLKLWEGMVLEMRDEYNIPLPFGDDLIEAVMR